jgi:hypothetical protein
MVSVNFTVEDFMKKSILVVVIAASIAGAVFAQNTGNPWGQAVTVDGTLGLQNGVIILTSGNTVYFVPYLARYAGFVDGLKEGARVSVQGYAGEYNTLIPTAFTVNGKSYDVSTFASGGAYGAGYCGGGYGTGHHGGGWRRGRHW